MTTTGVQAIADRAAAWLRNRGYHPAEDTEVKSYNFDGMGSVLVMARGRLVIEILNDRGDLMALLGDDARREEDFYGVDFWALCLGLLAVVGNRDWSMADEQWAERQEALLRDVVEKLDKLPESEWARTEACVRKKFEEYARTQGLWPWPKAGSIMRPDDRG